MATGRIAGKTALVTGGAMGIGKAVAKKILKEGGSVAIADINMDASTKTVEELSGLGGIRAVAYDASHANQSEECARIVEFTVKEFGQLDILVNNAGVQRRCPSISMSEKDFDWVMSIDIKAPFFCSQAAARAMRDRGGKIVSISSGNSRMVNPGRAPYCIAKAGINAMTRVLAAEWAMYGINVNAVAPGFIDTALMRRGVEMGILSLDAINSVLPMERLATEDEVADSVFYFITDEAAYVTGQTLFCDGGWSTDILPNALDYIKHPERFDTDS